METKQLTIPLTRLQPGQLVVLCHDDRPLGIGVCYKTTSRTATIKRRNGCLDGQAGIYWLSTGKSKDWPQWSIVAVNEGDIARIEFEIAEQREREQKNENERLEREARNAYDALPEAVKLARALRWLCDCEREEKIAGAPIEHLRGIIAWAKENKLTTE